MIHVTCPACGAEYNLTADYAGELVECKCGGRFVAPDPPLAPTAANPVPARSTLDAIMWVVVTLTVGALVLHYLPVIVRTLFPR